MPITVSPLSEAIGARIEGVDLSRELDPGTFDTIKDALFEHAIIVVPGQTLDEDDQERFCRYFGELEMVRSGQALGRDHPAVLMITNVTDSGRPTALEDGEMMFHYDQCYYENPALGSTLYAIEIPDEGGNTLFANCRLAYEALDVSLAGGTTLRLAHPRYTVLDPGYGSLHPEHMLSPRVAPQMIGMGLIEAIPEADILALADPGDTDGDGVSGRASLVRSARTGEWVLGRFGWKAGSATVAQQTARAFSGDIGLSSPHLPEAWGDCTQAQVRCREAPHGPDPVEGVEVPGEMFDLVVFYSRHLAVPARRVIADAAVLEGKRLFHAAGCTGCHRPKFVTARDADQPEHAFQLIWPYSDFLLHDMGEGLADHRPEGSASGREWRTAPLWGIGLTERVSGHSRFLHDGRARGLLEAVLWHGGEAEAAREAVVRMSDEEREALLAFMRSL